MQRILIVGCSGAGKTALALDLGKKLGLEVIHLDREFWQAGWKPTPQAEFRPRLRDLLAREAWVIDGNYDSSLEFRLTRADTAIFLDFSRWQCLSSVLWRTVKHHGRTRPEITPGCLEHFDWNFIRWIWGYRRTARPGILEAFQRFETKGGRTFIFRSRAETWKWLAQLGS